MLHSMFVLCFFFMLYIQVKVLILLVQYNIKVFLPLNF